MKKIERDINETIIKQANRAERSTKWGLAFKKIHKRKIGNEDKNSS